MAATGLGTDAENFRQACQEKGFLTNSAVNRHYYNQSRENSLEEDFLCKRHAMKELIPGRTVFALFETDLLL